MTYTLAAYLHDLDPYAIKLWKGGIRWYGVSYIAGFFVGFLIIRHIARMGHARVKPQQVADLVLALAIGAILGGRLGFVLLYNPKLFGFSSSFPFWNLLAIHQGGMASHGGLIGLVLAGLWYARRHDIPRAHILDLAAFAGPIGLFFGRVANFVNGELYGRPCAADFPLAVLFPQEMRSWTVTQMEKLSVVVEQVDVSVSQWQAALTSLGPSRVRIDDTISQLISRVQSAPANSSVIADALRPILTPRHPSQLYQAVLEGLVLFGVLAIAWTKPRKPGVIFGLCCAVYGIVRIISEYFRQPDDHIAHLEAAQWGVTRGQLLSALMLIAGVLIMVFCARRRVQPIGGWRR